MIKRGTGTNVIFLSRWGLYFLWLGFFPRLWNFRDALDFFLCSGIHLSMLLCLFIYSFLLNLNFVVLGEKVCSCQMSLNTRYIFCGTSWTNNLLFFFFCGWWEPISITRLLLSLRILNYFAFQSYQDYLYLCSVFKVLSSLFCRFINHKNPFI